MSKITIEVPMRPDEHEYHDFNPAIGPDVQAVTRSQVMGIRRSNGKPYPSDWDTVWCVNCRYNIEVTPASYGDVGLCRSKHLYELKQIEREHPHWVLTLERVEE
jgi:hypothetical protein